jgi:uncharacterized protein YggE
MGLKAYNDGNGGSHMRTITVRGSGAASAAPDTIELNMTINKLDKDYAKAMAQSSQAVVKLEDLAEAVGLAKTDLKTVTFNVSTRTSSYQDRLTKEWRDKFLGYEVTNRLRLAFAFDTDCLNNILSRLSQLEDLDPNLSIRFTIKDDASLKDQVLLSATSSARHRAELLAQASGVTLGDLQEINYSWGRVDFYSETEYQPKMLKANMMMEVEAMAFTPEDIEVSDEVTFVWEII